MIVKYKIRKNDIKYEAGRYYADNSGSLYQIIYDAEFGYSLLDVSSGKVTADFYRSTVELINEISADSLTPLKQVVTAKFEANYS